MQQLPTHRWTASPYRLAGSLVTAGPMFVAASPEKLLGLLPPSSPFSSFSSFFLLFFFLLLLFLRIFSFFFIFSSFPVARLESPPTSSPFYSFSNVTALLCTFVLVY
ncbi:unnamed protein product, partial [Cuscuta epithymum]